MNVYQLIAVVSAALAVAAGAWDAYRLRRNHQYSAVGLAISAGGPIISLIVYLLVTNLALKQIVTVGLLVLGGAVGVYVASRATLSEVGESGQIRMTGVSWLPLPAALSVGAIQICSAIGSLAGMVIALAALEASVGFGVAAAVLIVYRRSSTGVPGAKSPEPARLERP
jgi:hypothetical protein